MRVGLLIETFTHLAFALTTSPPVALGVMFLFGAHAFIWGTTATTIRQRAVPNELMGRVGGVYRVAILGGLVIGTPIGGLLASNFGITAPFWFGFIGSAILVVLLWGQFGYIAHSERRAGLSGRDRSQSLRPRRRAARLQLGDLDLAHLEHRFHRPASALGIRITQQLAQPARDDLPRDAPAILEPATRPGLAAVRRQRVPQPVDLRLVLAVDRRTRSPR